MVSSGPGFVGNKPGDDEIAGMALVALMGQTPVRVHGPVQAGEYIIPSGQNDGMGIAIPAHELTAQQVMQVVGLALESSTADDAQVMVLVGVPRDVPWASLLQQRDEQIVNMEARLAMLEQIVLSGSAPVAEAITCPAASD